MILLRSLAPYAATAPPPAEPDRHDQCELCGAAIGSDHRHVVECGVRGVRCTCGACALLFDRGAHFRTVGDRVRRDPAFALDAAAWRELGVPVGLAFFVRVGNAIRVGYPGAAGIVEAELDDAVWAKIADATPLASELVDEVEALVVRGERGAAELACYLVPITHAYELAGALRASWQGFSGGDAMRAQLAEFFAALDRMAGPGRNAGRGSPCP